MKLIDKLTFTSPVSREYSSSPTRQPLGEHESTMTLHRAPDGYRFAIEWDIPGLEMTEEIGLWCEAGANGPVLYDYDGVFELPAQAVTLLMRNGVTVPKEFR